ncbi:Hcp family type VI secretion system effector [Pseudomonas putida]|uniref:Major exported protein n=1 Tax=Pseudomonas putida TaxID=303 RepID=A0A1Q9R9G7_PSEPU|nr:Hcp family type VI secretion system effector [Pseudomonas putida]OLS63965.1 Major exported protein [Pseudomonas putida]
MSTPAFICIKAKTQGHITKDAFTPDSVGNIYQEGHEDQILVQEIEHEINTPTDPQSGQPVGKRVHGPFTFTSTLNKATPLLYQALSDGETLTEVEVKWYRPSVDGLQEHFFTTRLEDATIVNINTVLPHAQDEDSAKHSQLIKVAMAYRKISWIHDIARTEGSDDWRAPKES